MGVTSTSLAPGFLLASPPLGDPNFDRTVVLLAVHGDGGALGFVVNRKASLSMSELFRIAGYETEALEDDSPVLLGGPVQRSSGWILGLDLEVPSPSELITVGDRIGITSSREAFDALARDAKTRGASTIDPHKRIVLLGYSGWAPGQLEGEVAAGAWLPVPLDEGIVFSTKIEERWEKAYALLGLTPAFGMTMRSVGSA
ncbi:MAG: YqgE/AlgH family protein [Polyangiaceae bacterium]|nr:YqgE/AlgH family protein [Polyangiaceae bacterium]